VRGKKQKDQVFEGGSSISKSSPIPKGAKKKPPKRKERKFPGLKKIGATRAPTQTQEGKEGGITAGGQKEVKRKVAFC